MSVINRMLSDLERRGAPRKSSRAAPGATAAPARDAAGLRGLRARAPLLLLLALVLVAVALWWQRAPRILDGIESAGAYLVQRFSPAEPASSVPASAQESTAEDAPAVPRFSNVTYHQRNGGVQLRIVFSERLEASPGYAREGERIALRIPAQWASARVPAPPGNQRVFRGLVATPEAGDGSLLEFSVHPDARFDLAFSGDRLELAGRIPGDAAVPTAASGESASSAERERDPVRDGQDDTAVASAPESAPGGDDNGQPAQQGGNRAEAATPAESSAPEAGARDDADPAPSGDSPRATADTGAAPVRKSATTRSPAQRAQRLEREARRALDAGELASARDGLRAALELDPDRHEARELLVRLALRAGASASARKLLAQGIARAPERPGFAKPYARLLVDAGALERALRVLERAGTAAERDAGYHALVAAVAQRLERHERAARAYTRALSIDSGRGLWWLGLGISLAATERPQEAMAAFREARSSGDLNERLMNWVSDRIDALSSAEE